MTEPRLITLDDGRALDPAVVGAKAAGLARARRVSLPVLDGVVVPAAEAGAAMTLGVATLAERGSGRARLAVSGAATDAALAEELEAAGRILGERLVVRSSSALEADAVWSGAFASYAEIAPDEIPRAVAGCWASAFSRDALSRQEAEGIDPGAVGMAVLIQREIQCTTGGVATADPDGSVKIAGIAGSPAAIVAGWERGHLATIAPGGDISGDEAVVNLGAATLRAVAAMARRAAEGIGCDHLEWAVEGDDLRLLQVQQAARSPVPEEPEQPALEPVPGLPELVRLLIGYPGPVGEELIHPWALGLDELPEAESPGRPVGPDEILSEARILAATLVEQRWQQPADAGLQSARSLLAALHGDDPAGALAAAVALHPVDPELAARLLGLLDGLASGLAAAGRLRAPELLWYLNQGEVARLGSGTGPALDPTRRVGRGRWEPLVHSAVGALGTVLRGDPVVAGAAAGRVRLIRNAADAERFVPREVVAAVYPLNNLAPLLWDAAAVVTIGGSPGAHVFEVATALGVPAICGVDLAGGLGLTVSELQARRDLIAAVDGGSGVLAVLADED